MYLFDFNKTLHDEHRDHNTFFNYVCSLKSRQMCTWDAIKWKASLFLNIPICTCTGNHHHHNQIFDLHAGAGASSTSVCPLPGNWLADSIVYVTPDLQVPLSWGSTVLSFHSWQSFSISFFHVSWVPNHPCLPPICTCISHAVLTAPLERSTCLNQRILLSLKSKEIIGKWLWNGRFSIFYLCKIFL